MKTTWDELMRYAPEQEIPLPPMQDGEGARILSKTMGKIKETKQKPARPVRTVLIAAAIAALLCGSAFVAHSFGWFDRLFGEKAALVKDHVTSYDEATSTDITQPTYTEEEQAMIAEGTMQVPGGLEMTATINILEALATGGGPGKALLALGYSGWGPGQLEAEIARNDWLTCEAPEGLVFGPDDRVKWSAALRGMGIDPLTLSAAAGRA